MGLKGLLSLGVLWEGSRWFVRLSRVDTAGLWGYYWERCCVSCPASLEVLSRVDTLRLL